MPSASVATQTSVPPAALSPTAPQLAQLNLVLNLVTSAEHQLEVFQNAPNPPDPNNHGDENALDFLVRANAILDALDLPVVTAQAAPRVPIVHTETAVEYAVMLALIIVVCITAITLVNPPCTSVTTCPPPRPSVLYPQILAQLQHTEGIVNTLLGK